MMGPNAALHGADIDWGGFYVCEELLEVAGVSLGVFLERALRLVT
jgi:hypothetical protein